MPEELLRERLGSADRAVQRRACDEAAVQLRLHREFATELHELLWKGPPLARFAACVVLLREGRASLRLLEPLLASLELDDGDRRWSAAQMLAALGRAHPEVAAVLGHTAREDEAPLRRRMALYALRELTPGQAEETFRHALGDPDPKVCRAALMCFAKVPEPELESVERILRLAREHADPAMQRLAPVVLSELARALPEARPAVSALVEELALSSDPSLARAARAASARLHQR